MVSAATVGLLQYGCNSSQLVDTRQVPPPGWVLVAPGDIGLEFVLPGDPAISLKDDSFDCRSNSDAGSFSVRGNYVGEESAAEYVEDARKRIGQTMLNVKLHDVQFDGHRGIEYRLSKDKHNMQFVRVLAVDGWALDISIKIEDGISPKTTLRWFLESFRFVGSRRR